MLKYLCTLSLMLVCIGGFAQSSATESASTSKTQIDVLGVYEDVVAQGYESAQVYSKLANGRYFENNYEEAKKWFSKLFEMETNPEPIAYLRFSKTLTALEEFDLAEDYKARYEEVKDKK